MYVLGLAGFGIFLTLLFSLITGTNQPNSKEKVISSEVHRLNKGYLLAMLFIILSGIGFYMYSRYFAKDVRIETIQPTLSDAVHKMGRTLIESDYEKFADYNHITMQQSLGGKEKLTDLVRSTVEGMKEQEIYIDNISLSEIHEISQKGSNMQVIISQKVTFIQKVGNKTEMQKMLAVSEDRGKSWQFINITGKTKDQIQQFFPTLHQNLNF